MKLRRFDWRLGRSAVLICLGGVWASETCRVCVSGEQEVRPAGTNAPLAPVTRLQASHLCAASIATSMSKFTRTKRWFSGTGNKSCSSAARVADMPVSSICRPEDVILTA